MPGRRSDGSHGAYRGPDRRAAPVPCTPARPRDLASDAACLLAACGALSATVLAVRQAVPAATVPLTLLLAALATGACVVVAEQSFLRSRLVGDAVAARLCVAFAVYGVSAIPLAVCPVQGPGGAIGRLVAILGTAAALLATVRCPDVIATARLGVPTALVVTGAALATVAASSLPAPPAFLDARIAGLPWPEVVAAAALVATAGALTAAGLRRSRRTLTASGLAFGIAVVSPAVAAAGPTPPASRLLVTAVHAAALGLVVPWSVNDTRHALRAVGRDNAALRDRWRDALRRVEGLSRADAERTHELRSVLVALEGASEVLRRHVASLGAREDAALAAAVASEIGRLHELVSACPAAHGPYDVRQAVWPAVAARRACGQAIDVDVPDGIVVNGRAAALTEAVGNLLTNAAVHAPGSRVTVRAVAGDPVLLLVADDGPGMDATAAEPPVGSGLGLPVARRLVAENGGRLDVDSAPGRGTCVRIELPRAGARVERRAAFVVPRPDEEASWSGTAS